MNDQQLTTDVYESPEYLQTEEMLGEIGTIRLQNQQIIEALEALSKHKDGRYFNIKIADANMPFQSMIGLMMKIALASIPALILLFILGAAASVFLGGFFAAMIGG